MLILYIRKDYGKNKNKFSVTGFNQELEIYRKYRNLGKFYAKGYIEGAPLFNSRRETIKKIKEAQKLDGFDFELR
jgi:hypothetical protein